MAVTRRERYPIPEKLNIVLFVLIQLALWSLLWLASHESLGWALLAALGFALVNNTSFSLMHEAVHGIFSRNRFRNELFGTLCAPTFPTSYTLQKIAHLGHHRRNRSDKDLYDYYLPVIGMVALGLGKNTADLSAADLPAIREKLFAMKAVSKQVGEVVSSQTAIATAASARSRAATRSRGRARTLTACGCGRAGTARRRARCVGSCCGRSRGGSASPQICPPSRPPVFRE